MSKPCIFPCKYQNVNTPSNHPVGFLKISPVNILENRQKNLWQGLFLEKETEEKQQKKANCFVPKIRWFLRNFRHTNISEPLVSVSSVFNFCHSREFHIFLLKNSLALFRIKLLLELCEQEKWAFIQKL